MDREPPARERIAMVARAVLDLLGQGLDQDREGLAFLDSTFGPWDTGSLPGSLAESLGSLLADPESSQAALLLDFLLFPSAQAKAELEPVLAQASLSAAEALELTVVLADMLAENTNPILARFPDGSSLALPANPEAFSRFVARLAPERTPPPELTTALSARLAPDQALSARVSLRHSRLAWTRAETAFVRTVIEGLPERESLPDVLAFVLALLGRAEPGQPPLDLLAQRHRELTAQLGQAQRLDQARTQGSFEVLSSTGLRAPHLHADTLRQELTLLDAACRAVTGRAAQSLDSVTRQDLGQTDDPAGLLELLGGG